jgi:hypothetical protein
VRLLSGTQLQNYSDRSRVRRGWGVADRTWRFGPGGQSGIRIRQNGENLCTSVEADPFSPRSKFDKVVTMSQCGAPCDIFDDGGEKKNECFTKISPSYNGGHAASCRGAPQSESVDEAVRLCLLPIQASIVSTRVHLDLDSLTQSINIVTVYVWR